MSVGYHRVISGNTLARQAASCKKRYNCHTDSVVILGRLGDVDLCKAWNTEIAQEMSRSKDQQIIIDLFISLDPPASHTIYQLWPLLNQKASGKRQILVGPSLRDTKFYNVGTFASHEAKGMIQRPPRITRYLLIVLVCSLLSLAFSSCLFDCFDKSGAFNASETLKSFEFL